MCERESINSFYVSICLYSARLEDLTAKMPKLKSSGMLWCVYSYRRFESNTILRNVWNCLQIEINVTSQKTWILLCRSFILLLVFRYIHMGVNPYIQTLKKDIIFLRLSRNIRAYRQSFFVCFTLMQNIRNIRSWVHKICTNPEAT